MRPSEKAFRSHRTGIQCLRCRCTNSRSTCASRRSSPLIPSAPSAGEETTTSSIAKVTPSSSITSTTNNSSAAVAAASPPPPPFARHYAWGEEEERWKGRQGRKGWLEGGCRIGGSGGDSSGGKKKGAADGQSGGGGGLAVSASGANFGSAGDGAGGAAAAGASGAAEASGNNNSGVGGKRSGNGGGGDNNFTTVKTTGENIEMIKTKVTLIQFLIAVLKPLLAAATITTNNSALFLLSRRPRLSTERKRRSAPSARTVCRRENCFKSFMASPAMKISTSSTRPSSSAPSSATAARTLQNESETLSHRQSDCAAAFPRYCCRDDDGQKTRLSVGHRS